MKKKMIEINGNRYVVPSVFAEGCGISCQKIVAACKDGRVVGACMDTSGHWMIPVNAPKPLELEQIRQLLILTLVLKNRPSTVIEKEEEGTYFKIYHYLELAGFIERFDCSEDKIPYEAVLTEKGMSLVAAGPSMQINWFDIVSTAIQLFASVLTILSFSFRGL